MCTPTTEQTAKTTLENAIAAAIASSEYKPVERVSLFLEHTINNIIYDSNIENLWGPVWSLFLAKVVDEVRPTVSVDVAVLAMSGLLRRMTGHSDIRPASTLAKNVGLTVNSAFMTTQLCSVTRHQVEIATQACNNLCIPSPREMACVYSVLGDSTSPSDIEQLYKLKPNSDEPITEDDLPCMMAKMVVNNAKLVAERAAKRVKLASEQTEQVVVRHQQEILPILRTAPVTEQGNKRVEQIMDQLQRESAKVASESMTALRELIQAERELASAEKELVIVMLTKPPINCNP